MCLGRLRAFAWMLVLVLLTGLVAPAFASAGAHSHGSAAHSHDGLSDEHGHADNQVPGVHDECLTDADCILGHLGLALPSMASIELPPVARASYGPSGNSREAGSRPDQDIDPPRPLTLR